MCSKLVFALVLGLALPVMAQTAPVRRLTDVAFAGNPESMTITVSTEPPALLAKAFVDGEANLLVLRLADVDGETHWVKTSDEDVKRVLVKTVEGIVPSTEIRLRMKENLSPEILRAVRLELSGERLVMRVPRRLDVAERWMARPEAPKAAWVEPEAPLPTAAIGSSATSAPPPPAEPTPLAVEPVVLAPAEPVVLAPAAPVVEPAAALPVAPVLPAAPVVPSPAVAPAPEAKALEPKDIESQPLALDEDSNEPATTETGKPLGAPSLGVVGAALLLIASLGFIIWRKARTARFSASAGGPLIRPLSTHVIGPKQSLILVDVAGQLVLLGSSDKGVSLLTTIEPAAVAPEPARSVAQSAPIDGQGKTEGSFAHRLGRAFARVREAAPPEAPAVSGLEALAERTQEPGLAATRPSEPSEADLLRKIRQLRGA